MKKKVIAGLLTLLLVLSMFGPMAGQVANAATVNLSQYVEKNAGVIKNAAVSAYMKGDSTFYVFHTECSFASASRGVSSSNLESVKQEILNALNYLGTIAPEMSTPIFDRIEAPGPGSGQYKIYFCVRKDAASGEMKIGQKLAKEYISNHTVSSTHAAFNDGYVLMDEIKKYNESAYAALQVKAYEFFLEYAKKCTDMILNLPSDSLIKKKVTIPFSDFMNTFFDEPAFTQLFFEYQNLEESPNYRADIIKEMYESLWVLCHNSAFWLDNGADNTADKRTYCGVPYTVNEDSITITFTVSAVKETVYRGTNSSDNTNAAYCNNTFYDYFGRTHMITNVTSYKSIAVMATEFDEQIKKVLNSFYRPELSQAANEYAMLTFLRKYLNYGNLEGDDILNEKVTKPSVHIPYDVWNKANGNLMDNYSYVYTAMMNGNGICDAQTKVAQTLLMYMGIKSIPNSASGHVWNEVYFAGQRYVLDVGPHRPYPIFNVGKSFATNNKKTDAEFNAASDLGTKFANLDNMLGSTGYAEQTTVQDGEYVYYIDFTDNCNVYKVRLDGTGSPTKVYTAPGNNSVANIKSYILKNDGSTHERVYDNSLLSVWKRDFFTDPVPANVGTMEREMKLRTHTIAESWNYRSAAGLYYATLVKDGTGIYLKMKYLKNTGKVVNHTPVLTYRESYRVATVSNSSAYQTTATIRSTNTYSAGSLDTGGLIHGTVSAPSGDAIERILISHNGVAVYDRYSSSYPQAVGLGTGLVSNNYLTYGENKRTVAGKTKVFNDVTILATTQKKKMTTISAKPTNAYLVTDNKEYTITNVNVTAQGGYLLNLDVFDDDTWKTDKYAFTWNGRKPSKAGKLNAIGHYNKDTKTIYVVLENGEIREFQILSNGKVIDNSNLHLYRAGEINLFSAADWSAYASLVSRKYYQTGYCVVLQKDIDFKRGSIAPIGSSSVAVSITFDGNGYRLSNGTVASSGTYTGLFGNVNGGKITNFLASNITVNGTQYSGLIGYATGATVSKIRVTDCSIKGGSYVGTVGYAKNTKISGIFITDRMGISGTNYVGGVLGGAGGSVSIQNCYNAADISGTSYVGGILGASPMSVSYASEETKVTCNFNAGSVTASKNYGDGTVGYHYHAVFFRNENYGKVKVAGR